MAAVRDRERLLIEQKDRDELQYVSGMLGELRVIVAGRRDDMLTYLIEMAYIEAYDRLRSRGDTKGSSSNGPDSKGR